MNSGLRRILDDVIKGDDSAFRQLFDLYRPNIYTTALRITNDENLSEDILQDTFVKVWMKRALLKDVENFEAWLYIIARNITFNLIKRQRAYKAYFESECQEIVLKVYPESDYLIQEKEFQSILRNAVDRLPPKQKETYRLIKESDLKRNEVATILGVSPETVKWNLDQAMKSIRAYCFFQINDMPLIVFLLFFSKYC